MGNNLKFRAWDGKKMYLPEYSDKEDFHILPDGSIVETHEHGYERHELTSYRGDNWKVMQWTGLTDKNGKEIYRRDVVSVPYVDPMGNLTNDEDYRAEVVYKNGAYGIVTESGFHPLKDWCVPEQREYVPNVGIVYTYSDNVVLTVIGNIYEHPELLNTKTL